MSRDANDIREMEYERGRFVALTPVSVGLLLLALAFRLPGPSIVLACLFVAWSVFGWWLFWRGCKDYDRASRSGKGTGR